MIKLTNKGDLKLTTSFLERASKDFDLSILHKYGEKGIAALKAGTPIDSGETANSWSYNIRKASGIINLEFFNSHINNGVPIAIILQYGHGTGTGGYVSGIDYINPALKPIFDALSNDIWRELTR